MPHAYHFKRLPLLLRGSRDRLFDNAPKHFIHGPGGFAVHIQSFQALKNDCFFFFRSLVFGSRWGRCCHVHSYPYCLAFQSLRKLREIMSRCSSVSANGYSRTSLGFSLIAGFIASILSSSILHGRFRNRHRRQFCKTGRQRTPLR